MSSWTVTVTMTMTLTMTQTVHVTVTVTVTGWTTSTTSPLSDRYLVMGLADLAGLPLFLLGSMTMGTGAATTGSWSRRCGLDK